jgi:hypothetical protein
MKLYFSALMSHEPPNFPSVLPQKKPISIKFTKGRSYMCSEYGASCTSWQNCQADGKTQSEPVDLETKLVNRRMVWKTPVPTAHCRGISLMLLNRPHFLHLHMEAVITVSSSALTFFLRSPDHLSNQYQYQPT